MKLGRLLEVAARALACANFVAFGLVGLFGFPPPIGFALLGGAVLIPFYAVERLARWLGRTRPDRPEIAFLIYSFPLAAVARILWMWKPAEDPLIVPVILIALGLVLVGYRFLGRRYRSMLGLVAVCTLPLCFVLGDGKSLPFVCDSHWGPLDCVEYTWSHGDQFLLAALVSLTSATALQWFADRRVPVDPELEVEHRPPPSR